MRCLSLPPIRQQSRRSPPLGQSLRFQFDFPRRSGGEDVVEQDHWLTVRSSHLHSSVCRYLARFHSEEPGIGEIDGVVYQFFVGRLDTRLIQAETRGEPAKDLGV